MMIVTKSQDIECCRKCFLYEPVKDMSATIPACRELCDRELDSYLKFNKNCNENNSIALNCPFWTDLREKISDSLKEVISKASTDHLDRLKEITHLLKNDLEAKGIEIEIPFDSEKFS